MIIVRAESHESSEKCAFETNELQAVEYARLEMMYESLAWCTEHGAALILQNHTMAITRRLVEDRMREIEDKIRLTERVKKDG